MGVAKKYGKQEIMDSRRALQVISNELIQVQVLILLRLKVATGFWSVTNRKQDEVILPMLFLMIKEQCGNGIKTLKMIHEKKKQRIHYPEVVQLSSSYSRYGWIYSYCLFLSLQ